MLLKRYGHRIRARDIAEIIGCSLKAAEQMKSRHCRSRTGSRLSLETAREIFTQLKQGLPVSAVDIRLSYTRAITTGLRWEDWQLSELKGSIGRRPLKAIADDLGRNRESVYHKAQRLKLMPFKYTVSYIARKLMLTRDTVMAWLSPGSGRTKGYRLRWYVDGRFKLIHRADAEWLLDSRKRARGDDFLDHPGKLMEYDEANNEEAL
jgi:predicted transcriptional regulator